MPRVAAILVVADGAEWLGSVLATVAAQRYPMLDLVAVDNASRDGSGDLLAKRIHPDRLVTLRRRVGFGRAVAAAFALPVVADADLVLFLHDDLVLAPDALARLVRALQHDPTLGIVGPKLREWSDDYVLQEVGMTIDRFGRAEAQLEPAELDQGQHDRQRDVLYVSTAGMLVPRDVLRRLGGFDPRMVLLRDDLDLCWRAWLRGYRVEVVPAAVGYHVAAASRHLRRVGHGRPWEPRELAERHTLAALLKNYGAGRLAWVLPVVALLALGKTLGFLATRRFGDAWAVVQAYVWNIGQLPRTLRRRRAIQRRRAVSDSDIVGLFAPGLPRARAYAEALGSWLAGGSTRALIDEREEEDAGVDAERDPLGSWALARVVRRYPAACAGALLLVVYLIGLVPLLGAGQLVGGQVAPWPDTTREFLRLYASPWNGEPVASAAFASPIQAVLGVLSFLGFGSEWLAQRLLVLGLVPLAWVFALRAGRLVTSRPAPRVLGATLYALSPVVLGALAQGRWGVLVVAALLPGLVLVGVRSADPDTAPGSAWRAAALLALGLVTGIAAEPALGPLLALGWLVALAVATRQPSDTRGPRYRLLVAGAATLALLLPWLVGLARVGLPPLARANGVLPLWRALTLAPDTLPGIAGLDGVVSAVTAVAVVVAAVLLGLRTRPRAVVALSVVVVLAALAAWAVDRAGVPWLWAPALLLPAALSLAGLGVIAARYLVRSLRAYTFGARQLGTVVAVVLIAVGLLSAVVRLAAGPWSALQRDGELVPAFVAADEPRVGPYRVLVLSADRGAVRWDVTAASGPTMATYGTLHSPQLLDVIGDAVRTAAGGGDTSAGAELGLANVRYVLVTGDDGGDLRQALARQPALEPLPSGGGRVYRVRSWLPRAVLLSPERGEALLATGDPGDTADVESARMLRLRPGLFVAPGANQPGGLLVVSEAESRLWRAPGERRALDGVNAFVLPTTAGDVRARVPSGAHRAVVAGQLLLALAVISLALRPPGFTQRRVDSELGRVLPERLDDAVDGSAAPLHEGSTS